MDTWSFLKMHGLGNDFVVLDGRHRPLALTRQQVRAIADRRIGVGCDQLIVLEPPSDDRSQALMRIHNADGGEVEACGNAARCVGRLLMDETGHDSAVIATAAGVITAAADGERIVVDMGAPRLDWAQIPLAEPMDTLHVPVNVDSLSEAVAVNVGNPHAVFFVADVSSVPLANLGPRIEHHALFPERTNVEIIQTLARNRLRLRVWERGAGETRACGTGACAALVAAHRRGLADRTATVVLDGGELIISWREDDHVMMSGPVATAFSGVLDPSVLA